MLLGRADEVARIGGLLRRAARERASGALIVHGDPGVGKTALLEHVARDEEFLVLRSRPLKGEAELPFSGLFDLLRPIQGLFDRLPEPQHAALAGALALGPATPGDRFAVAVATLSLLAVAADDTPVLGLVDDAQWLDAASREALLFAGRRLGGEGVVLLMGMRPAEWLHKAGLATRELRGLSRADAAALVERTATVAPAVRDRLVDESRGNPLAILEAAATLSQDELCGVAPIERSLPIGDTLEQTFATPLTALEPAAQGAQLVDATSDGALARAERVGVIGVGERDQARHPLLCLAGSQAHDRVPSRAARKALNRTLGGDERSTSFAAASAEPDEAVAHELERAAAHALGRRAYGSAAAAYETAARLSRGDGESLRRSIEAGRALWLSGESARAADLLEGLIERASDPVVRAEIARLCGAAMVFSRTLPATKALLVAEAERVLPHDRGRAAALFVHATLSCLPSGDFAGGEAFARHALAAAHDDHPDATIAASTLLGTVFASRGQAGPARAKLELGLAHTNSIDPMSDLFPILTVRAQSLVWIEQWELAEETFEGLIAAVRNASLPSALPLPLAMLSQFELRRGRLAASYAAASESVQLAVDTEQPVVMAIALVTLARVEAVLGHDDDCRRHVASATQLSHTTGATSIDNYCAAALGLLELSRARPERAVEHLADCARLDAEHDIRLPSIAQSAADRVEAYVRTGALAQARAALSTLEAQATAAGLRWPLGAAARCRGLLSRDDFERHFADALQHFGTDMAFERARTHLSLGIRRRRAGQRARAREALDQALVYFEAAGAVPFAEQTRAELRASGARASALAPASSLSELTAQELQVSLIVAKGATNREAAAALFLSEKTIEFHLSNAYRKLGTRSRTELARRVEGLS